MFDTGSAIPLVSESEAKRLRLQTGLAQTRINDIYGQVIDVRPALARLLVIGNFELRNVAFFVVSDKRKPFALLPSRERGILGTPILFALRSIRWTKDGIFETGIKLGQPTLSGPLCFEGSILIAEVATQQKTFDVGLDTGAVKSTLWQGFAKDFEDLTKSYGRKQSLPIEGMGGTRWYEVVVLQSLVIRIAGFPTVLRPAFVLLGQTSPRGEYIDGNIGLDLLNQSHAVSIDLTTMNLTVE